MRYTEFSSTLVEAIDQNKPVTKADVEATLRKNGYEQFKINGNKINVLVQIPDGAKKNEFRSDVLNEIIEVLKKAYANDGVEYSSDPGISSLGGIIFANSPVQVVVKDSGKQVQV
jgi:preprotein translocase subunit SecF